MNIHENANELICIFNTKLKGNVNAFLVPTLLIYIEHRLRYE